MKKSAGKTGIVQNKNPLLGSRSPDALHNPKYLQQQRVFTMTTPNTIPAIKLLIGGQFVESSSNQWRDIVNPATQQVLARVPFATDDEMQAAVASAKEAFKTWRKTPIGTRARIFLKYQQLIRENIKELAAILTAEQGKTLADAEGDVFRAWKWSSTPPTSAACKWAKWPTIWPLQWTPIPCNSR